MAESNLAIIANLVADCARSQPELDVLTFENNGELEVRTYQQLWENGQRIARALAGVGMRRGDRFALLMLNHPEFVEAMVASAILGTVFVPIDARTPGAKLQYMLRDSACRGAICGPYALTALITACVDAAPIEWAFVVGTEWASTSGRGPFRISPLAPVLSSPVPIPSLAVATTDAAEPMQVMYTSGTTGDPKGIVVPHVRFGSVSNQGESVFGYRPGDRPYTGLSLTHGNAQFVTLAPSLKMGLRAVISRKFSKSRLWDIVRRHGCTSFSLLGGMATAIYSEPRRENDADNPVRLVISAGMPAAIWEDFARRFGVEIFEFYGAVEGGMTFKPVGEGPVGSCGRVAPGLVAKVVDEAGREVPRGTSGELWFQLANGPFPPVVYLNNPAASASKTESGWLRSGDIVHMNEQGWIFYKHRKGGGIRRNGEFVNAPFIEKTLAEHPQIDDVFVYGVPSANGAPGEKDIVAAVVPKDAARFDAMALFEWLRGRLEPNSVPSFIQPVSEIPKTASEKPQERFLIEHLEGKPETVARASTRPCAPSQQSRHQRKS